MQAVESYSPPEDAQTWTNRGYWKDWINHPLSSYPDDPTTIPGVVWLSEGMSLTDGRYAYAYRKSDNLIAVNYMGTAANTNNAISHSYLASGGAVYAAGIFVVQDGKVTEVNSASGHYRPNPKMSAFVNAQCREVTEPGESLEYVTRKLAELNLAAPTVGKNPFRPPGLDKEKIDCHARRQGAELTWNPPDWNQE